jgi:hypothetical protein
MQITVRNVGLNGSKHAMKTAKNAELTFAGEICGY